MQRRLRVLRLPVRLAAAALLFVACLSSVAVAQGFGSSKKKVTLQRKLPPRAHLNGSTINVRVMGHNIQSDVSADLRNMLEAELLKDDHRLRADDKHPDSIIGCDITEYVPPDGADLDALHLRARIEEAEPGNGHTLQRNPEAGLRCQRRPQRTHPRFPTTSPPSTTTSSTSTAPPARA